MPPARVIGTVVVALFLAALAGWAVSALPWYRGLGLTPPQRKAVTAGIVVVLAATIAWLLVVFPAYWD